MTALYLVLLLLSALCFLVATFSVPVADRVKRPLNLVALGLLFFVLVPLIQRIVALD